MPELDTSVLLTAARVAFRHLDSCSAREREAVLKSLIEIGTDEEARGADVQLFHEQKAREAQLTLKSVVDGIGGAS